jgi:phosphate transport system substrate-binding protein
MQSPDRTSFCSGRACAAVALVLIVTSLQTARSETLQIPGSGPAEATLRSLAAAFERANPPVRVEVPPSIGLAGGLRAVLSGASPIARIGRPLMEGEIKQGLNQYVYGTDAVVFAVGAHVTLKDLKSDQALAIFGGHVTDWRTLGAEAGPVRVFYREPTEISHLQLKRHVPDFEKLVFPSSAKLLHSDNEMVDGLSKSPSAIGWLTYSTAVLRMDGKINALTYNGIAPTAENLRVGRYQMVVQHVMIYRENQLTPLARRFLAYLATDEAAALMARAGAVHHKP